MKIARSSIPWILIPFLLSIIFVFLSIIFKDLLGSVFLFLSLILFLLSVFFLFFFRDPEREIGEGIVAVADGMIREISKLKDGDVGDCTRISTFMNVYNVHVNRMPIEGVIKNVVHIPGSYLPAFKKESEKNERVIIKLDSKIGMLKVVQIAGTLARRIVPYVKKGDTIKKGEKIGIIRLGSRVDVYLPTKKIKSINVKAKDKIKAGEDTIAEMYD